MTAANHIQSVQPFLVRKRAEHPSCVFASLRELLS